MSPLDDEAIEDRLGGLNGWARKGEAIEKEFDHGDFAGSVAFVNRIAPVAEELNHHPDLSISWSTVRVTITTHSEGGLTENDFELAKKIDPLA